MSVQVPDILNALEAVRNREDIQSVVMEHEAVNVIIRFVDHSIDHLAWSYILPGIKFSSTYMSDSSSHSESIFGCTSV